MNTAIYVGELSLIAALIVILKTKNDYKPELSYRSAMSSSTWVTTDNGMPIPPATLISPWMSSSRLVEYFIVCLPLARLPCIIPRNTSFSRQLCQQLPKGFQLLLPHRTHQYSSHTCQLHHYRVSHPQASFLGIARTGNQFNINTFKSITSKCKH